MRCHHDNKRWCFDWLIFILFGLIVGFIIGLTTTLSKDIELINIQIFRKGVVNYERNNVPMQKM